MELALNLLWLLAAAAALWRWSACGRARGQRQFLIGLAALGCALVLFFPVVSASDDLHAATAAMEDYSLSARKLRAAGHSLTSTSHYGSSFVQPPVWIRPIAICDGAIILTISRAAQPSACAPHRGRAPPFLLRS